MADILNMNCPKKLHAKHAARMKNGNLECWREDVEDQQLLSTKSSGTNGTAMTAQYARPTVVRKPENLEDSFQDMYSGFVNGMQIPTDGVQLARLTCTIKTNGINGATNLTNEEEQIEVKKVTFKEQD